jgi:hypothetical protein
LILQLKRNNYYFFAPVFPPTRKLTGAPAFSPGIPTNSDKPQHTAKQKIKSSYRSIDGTKVTMYAKWKSMQHYQNMRNNAPASPYLEEALK